MECYDAAKLMLSACTVLLLILNWKKSFLLLEIKFRDHGKDEAKQQPATLVDGLSNQEK